MTETIELGGSIKLTGFSDLEHGLLVVVKKIVGSYAKHFSEITTGFQELHVTLKTVHEREKSEKYELHSKILDNGNVYNAEITDMNLFFALDKVLKKVESTMGK